jgi:hypothetical protein
VTSTSRRRATSCSPTPARRSTPPARARASGRRRSSCATLFGVDYPINGGDLILDAGGDIRGAATRQFFSEWLQRLGGPSSIGDLPTAWGVSFVNFAQNIGALGGGNVRVTAGGDITNLSISLPTTAQHQGDASFDGS